MLDRSYFLLVKKAFYGVPRRGLTTINRWGTVDNKVVLRLADHGPGLCPGSRPGSDLQFCRAKITQNS